MCYDNIHYSLSRTHVMVDFNYIIYHASHTQVGIKILAKLLKSQGVGSKSCKICADGDVKVAKALKDEWIWLLLRLCSGKFHTHTHTQTQTQTQCLLGQPYTNTHTHTHVHTCLSLISTHSHIHSHAGHLNKNWGMVITDRAKRKSHKDISAEEVFDCCFRSYT